MGCAGNRGLFGGGPNGTRSNLHNSSTRFHCTLIHLQRVLGAYFGIPRRGDAVTDLGSSSPPTCVTKSPRGSCPQAARQASRQRSSEHPLDRRDGVRDMPFRTHRQRPSARNPWGGEGRGRRRPAQRENAPAVPCPKTRTSRCRGRRGPVLLASMGPDRAYTIQVRDFTTSRWVPRVATHTVS